MRNKDVQNYGREKVNRRSKLQKKNILFTKTAERRFLSSCGNMEIMKEGSRKIILGILVF